MNLVCNCFKAKELVLDTLAGTLETEKVSLQLTEHHRSVGCEKESACFQDELHSLV